MTDRSKISTASSGLRPLAPFPHPSLAPHNALEENNTRTKTLTIAEEAASRAMNAVYELLPSVKTLDAKTCNLVTYVHRVPISLAISRMIDDINSKSYLSHPTSQVHTNLDQPISQTEYQIPPDLSWRSNAQHSEGIESGSYYHFLLDREESLANQRAHGSRDHLRDVETILTKREIKFVLKHNMIAENPSLFFPRSATRVPFIRMDISKEGAAALTGDNGKLFEELCSWGDNYEGQGSGNE